MASTHDYKPDLRNDNIQIYVNGEFLSRKKAFSIRMVLIHVNGITDAVANSEFFSNIIDFSELLSKNSEITY